MSRIRIAPLVSSLNFNRLVAAILHYQDYPSYTYTHTHPSFPSELNADISVFFLEKSPDSIKSNVLKSTSRQSFIIQDLLCRNCYNIYLAPNIFL
jgi:hypothetical protein